MNNKMYQCKTQCLDGFELPVARDLSPAFIMQCFLICSSKELFTMLVVVLKIAFYRCRHVSIIANPHHLTGLDLEKHLTVLG